MKHLLALLLWTQSAPLIQLSVIVADSHGRLVDNLTVSDFTILHRDQPQSITRFSIERSAPSKPNPPLRPGVFTNAHAAKPSVRYSFAVQPTTLAGGLQVQVHRPDVHAYFMHPATIEHALQNPFEYTGLILSAVLTSPPGEDFLLTLRVAPEGITFTPKGALYQAILDVYYFLPDKQIRHTQNYSLALTQSQYEKVREQGMLIRRAFQKDVQLRTLKIVVQDKPSGAIGSLHTTLHHLRESDSTVIK